MPRAKVRTDDPVQLEADDLLDLAQQLEQAAKDTRAHAAALRASARGLRPGESGLLPGWGYVYARNRLYTLDRWRDTEPVATRSAATLP